MPINIISVCQIVLMNVLLLEMLVISLMLMFQLVLSLMLMCSVYENNNYVSLSYIFIYQWRKWEIQALSKRYPLAMNVKTINAATHWTQLAVQNCDFQAINCVGDYKYCQKKQQCLFIIASRATQVNITSFIFFI